MKIFVVIPGYNEELTIGALIEKCISKNLEVLFVDDGSTDSSSDIACKYGAVVIKNDVKKGKGFSLRKGFDLAISRGCDGVISLDSDGQHDIDDIASFIKLANEENADVIVGNRMNSHKGMPFVRYITNKFMSFLISIACRQKISDSQCGYRYLSRKVLEDISLKSNFFEIETEILMKASKKGYKIRAVDIKTIYRDETSKINPFKDTIKFIIYFFKELFSKSD